MKMQKFLCVTGILEIALAVILGLQAWSGFASRTDHAAIQALGGAKYGVIVAALLFFPVIRLLGGIIGVIGRGRVLLISFGILMIVTSIPTVDTLITIAQNDKIGLSVVLSMVALIVSVLYLIGGLFYRKPDARSKEGHHHHHHEEDGE